MPPTLIPGIASQSLGRIPNHDLPTRIHAAANHAMRSIEIFYEDLEHFSHTLASSTIPPTSTSFPTSTPSQERLLTAASQISDLCQTLNISVICLQPFMHYEGLLSPAQHTQRLNDLKFWITLAHRLNTDLIQIPSNFLPATQCTGDMDRIVSDLREAADIGAHADPPIRFAYEALCWGTHVNTWEKAWEIVQRVDRENLGTCLDTFNICGRVFADPERDGGRNFNAREDVERSVALLRSELSKGDNIRKVFYVEVVDGERLEEPLTEKHAWYNAEQPARMSWSRNARLFPFEEGRGGYLPWREVLGAILDAGYEGVVSFELFSRTGYEVGEGVVEGHAVRAERSWGLLERWVEEREREKRVANLTEAARELLQPWQGTPGLVRAAL